MSVNLLSRDARHAGRTDRIVLVVVCLLTVLVFVGASAFNTRGEPREAIVAMSMLKDGNWILPVNNGDEIAFKPPLLHWFVALFSLPAGNVSVLTSRLPSALATLGLVLSTYGFFARRADRLTALVAALVLLTSFEVHRAALTCRVDMLLAALTVGAFYALYRWGERGLRGVPWGGLACVAGAALTKGPVGIVLPVGVVALWLWLCGRRRFWPVAWRFGLVALAGLVPLAVWYVLAYHEPHGGARFLRLIYEENVLRFTGGMSYASHINPWYYNVGTILTGMLPFTMLLVLFVPAAVRRLPAVARALKGIGSWRPLARLRRMDAADSFALVGFAVVFIFYCIPASKRSVYLLPLYPFMAWGMARWLIDLSRRRRAYVATLTVIVGTILMLVVAAYLCLRAGLVPDSLFAHGRHADETLAYVHGLALQPWGFRTVVCLFLPLFAGIRLMRRHRFSAVAVPLVTAALWMIFEGVAKPPIAAAKTDRPVADYIARIQPAGRIYSFRTDILEANRMHPFTINFYLGDRVIPIDKARPLPTHGLLIVGNDEIEAFVRQYPAYAVSLVRDTHHRSCDDRKNLRIYRFAGKSRLPGNGEK